MKGCIVFLDNFRKDRLLEFFSVLKEDLVDFTVESLVLGLHQAEVVASLLVCTVSHQGGPDIHHADLLEHLRNHLNLAFFL